MKKYEMVEIGYWETTLNSAFIKWGKKCGFNMKTNWQTFKTEVTINKQQYVLGNYKVCKNGMILADLVKV